MEKTLPAIPAKRYFTIGEVSDLCGVKPYVLRYWEQEFTQLKPMKRRGNRRYYQHHEVLLVRRIRELLYEQGFTISGARNRLTDSPQRRDAAEHEGAPSALGAEKGAEHWDGRDRRAPREVDDHVAPDGRAGTGRVDGHDGHAFPANGHHDRIAVEAHAAALAPRDTFPLSPAQVRQELLSIRGLLAP